MLQKSSKPAPLLFGDFYLVDVVYDEQTGLASELLICEPRNFQPGAPFWASRKAVIGLIADGYCLELFPPDGRPFLKRWFVRVVNVQGTNYLRTDSLVLAGDHITYSDC